MDSEIKFNESGSRPNVYHHRGQVPSQHHHHNCNPSGSMSIPCKMPCMASARHFQKVSGNLNQNMNEYQTCAESEISVSPGASPIPQFQCGCKCRDCDKIRHAFEFKHVIDDILSKIGTYTMRNAEYYRMLSKKYITYAMVCEYLRHLETQKSRPDNNILSRENEVYDLITDEVPITEASQLNQVGKTCSGEESDENYDTISVLHNPEIQRRPESIHSYSIIKEAKNTKGKFNQKISKRSEKKVAKSPRKLKEKVHRSNHNSMSEKTHHHGDQKDNSARMHGSYALVGKQQPLSPQSQSPQESIIYDLTTSSEIEEEKPTSLLLCPEKFKKSVVFSFDDMPPSRLPSDEVPQKSSISVRESEERLEDQGLESSTSLSCDLESMNRQHDNQAPTDLQGLWDKLTRFTLF